MSTGLRLLLVIGLFAALVGSVLFVSSGGLALLGRECGELPDLLGQLNEERRREAELDREWQRTLRRITVKSQAVEALIDGHLSLMQAAARFRDLEETPGDTRNPPGRSAGGTADGERLCREVIQWVHGHLRRSDPEFADEMAACLEAELWQHQALDGRIDLPR